MKFGNAPSEFNKSVATILGGSTLAQLIPLGSEIILVRLFTPVEFGILALFLAVATIFSSVAGLRYEQAIVLAKEDSSAINILILSMGIAVIIALLSGIIVYFFGNLIASWVDAALLNQYLKWAPLYILVFGVFQSFNLWATRKKYYRRIAGSKISQSGSNALVAIGSGWKGAQAGGLIAGHIVGGLFASMPLVWKFWKQDRHLLSLVSWEGIKEEAIKHKDFPRINSLHILSDIGQQSIFSTLIARLYGSGVLGFYSRMIRIVKVPAGFIGSAVGQVFYQTAIEEWQKSKNIRPAFSKQLKKMIYLGIPIFALLAIWGPEIFGFVLTEKWEIAGKYAQILSPWMFLNFIVSPFTYIPLIAEKQQRFFTISLVMNLSVIASLLVAYALNDHFETALYFLCTVQVIFHSYLLYWLYKIARV
jgi:O-antigen/teichoic acid export membrane protein